MTIRKNLKRHKEVMNLLADLVMEEDSDDCEIVEILCRKLTELGYLKDRSEVENDKSRKDDE